MSQYTYSILLLSTSSVTVKNSFDNIVNFKANNLERETSITIKSFEERIKLNLQFFLFTNTHYQDLDLL